MKIRILFLSLLFIRAVFGSDWDKSRFDLTQPRSLQKTSNQLTTDYYEFRAEIGEITLIEGGYFTIGTHHGTSGSRLDDKCGITFGHPFALTSFPLLTLNGKLGRMEDFFNTAGQPPTRSRDTLRVQYQTPDLLEWQFCLVLKNQGQTVEIINRVRNLSPQDQKVQLGLVFDAGLGKWGDGWANFANREVRTSELLTEIAVPNSCWINERSGSSKGMQISLDWGVTPPVRLAIANWRQIYTHAAPDWVPNLNEKLYDLALLGFWPETTLAPGTALVQSTTVNLETPDFGASLFTRWNLPDAMAIENGRLFPQKLASLLEITNQSGQYFSNCQINLTHDPLLTSTNTNYNFNAAGQATSYFPLDFEIGEYYEDQIVDLQLELQVNGVVTDNFLQRLFIPVTPVSDTGLVCIIDSVNAQKFPAVSLTFHALVAETQARIRDLAPKNIFLYENNQRITNFSLAKDISGKADKIDVVFVIDCSGSMGDDINQVRTYVGEFCDSLKVQGYDYRLGLIFFSDNVHLMTDLTTDLNAFKNYLATVNLYGGRENSLGAIYKGTELSFRPESKRTMIWITDENYPVAPEINLTVQDVVNRLLLYNITVHSISLVELKSTWSDPIIEPTGGNFYNIYGNFRDILLDISHAGYVSNYLLSYPSPQPRVGSHEVKLEIHYAGLGGMVTTQYTLTTGAPNLAEKSLSCYPNPFNPTIQIQAILPSQASGAIDIYNILGQRVQSFTLAPTASKQMIRWNGRDFLGEEIATGHYFIQFRAFHENGSLLHQEIKKVLYMK
ncbi:VWA domain-containing protein [candidate division KSB1 bacterium]|nr:VWA domain-containing protein [candidate division KSB1 bacterium]